MAINFPNNPSQGDRHEENGLSWVFDGTAWDQEPLTVIGPTGPAGPVGPPGPPPIPTVIPHGRFELVGESIVAGNITGASTIFDVEPYFDGDFTAPPAMPFTDIVIEEGGMSLNLGDWRPANNTYQNISLPGNALLMSMTVPVTGPYKYKAAFPPATEIQTNDRPFPMICVNQAPREATILMKTDTSTDSDVMSANGVVNLIAGDVVQMAFGVEGGDTEAWNCRPGIGTTFAGIPKNILGYFELELMTGTTDILGSFDFGIACSDETTELTGDQATAKATVPAWPTNCTVREIIAGFRGAPTGAAAVVDVHVNGTSMFSVLPSVDDGETTTETATTPAVISTDEIDRGDLVEIFLNSTGLTYGGNGLQVWFLTDRQ